MKLTAEIKHRIKELTVLLRYESGADTVVTLCIGKDGDTLETYGWSSDSDQADSHDVIENRCLSMMRAADDMLRKATINECYLIVRNPKGDEPVNTIENGKRGAIH